MMKNIIIFGVATIIALMFLLGNVHAEDCNPDQQINSCYPALRERGSPSSDCCNEIVAHKRCLCKYADLNSFILPPNYQFVRNIAESCGVNFPICPDH